MDFDFRMLETRDDGCIEALGLGHIALHAGERTYDSEASGHGSMMLLLSLVGLLDGIVSLQSGTRRSYEYVGVGGSFSLLFSLENDDTIAWGDGPHRETCPVDAFAANLASEVRSLLHEKTLIGSGADAVYADLSAAMDAFADVFPSSKDQLGSMVFDARVVDSS